MLAIPEELLACKLAAAFRTANDRRRLHADVPSQIIFAPRARHVIGLDRRGRWMSHWPGRVRRSLQYSGLAMPARHIEIMTIGICELLRLNSLWTSHARE